MTDTFDGLLAEAARKHPDRAALVLPRGRGWSTTTFRTLDLRVDAVAAGLAAAGLGTGERAALLVPPGPDFFVLAFALLRMRVVPVLVDPGIGRTHLRTCLGEAAPAAFLGVVKAHLARRALGWCPDARLSVGVGPGGPLVGVPLHRVERSGLARLPFRPPPRTNGPAAIVFTSGSTGVPKGVEQTDATLRAQLRLVSSLYGLDADETLLATFPPFALFGPPLGMTTVVPRMDATRPADVDPRRVVRAAREHGATVMFGSPALLDTLSRGAAPGSLPTVRRVVSAGAPVPRDVQRRTLALLAPGAQVHTPYGATEALPVTTIGSDELLQLPGPGICVGRPVPGVDVALLQITDDPVAALTEELLVAPGEVGEVVVRGDNVTTAYADRPAATRQAKTDWDGRVAHRMGDLARMDEAGRLWFAGRKSHRLETADGPMYSVPCEEVFNAHPAVRRTALVGTGPWGAQTPVLCVELEPGSRPSPALTGELLDLGSADPQTASIRTVLYHPRFPVDIRHNSKIDRPRLAEWAATR